MNNTSKKKERKRTIQDKLISGFNSIRYVLTEPIMLRIARLHYARLYEDVHENPLVSIYIPTYNRAELLMERAVASVLAQTYKNFELIILGDCCTDNTEELVSEIKDPRLRFYNLPKRGYRYSPTAENHWLAGPVVPANKALELVHGNWIARLDDDDMWTPDHIEVLLRFAQKGHMSLCLRLIFQNVAAKRLWLMQKTKSPGLAELKRGYTVRIYDFSNTTLIVGGRAGIALTTQTFKPDFSVLASGLDFSGKL